MRLLPFPRCLTDSAYLLCAISTVDDNTAESDKLDASEASHVTTPRTSSALPTRPSGLERNHASSIGDTVLTISLVILHMHPDSAIKIPIEKLIRTEYVLYQGTTNSRESSGFRAHTPYCEPFAEQPTWTSHMIPFRRPGSTLRRMTQTK